VPQQQAASGQARKENAVAISNFLAKHHPRGGGVSVCFGLYFEGAHNFIPPCWLSG